MKNLARCLWVMLAIIFCDNIYAQQWMPYQEYGSFVHQTTTIQQQQQPTIIYQYYPQVVTTNVVVEQRCWLRKYYVLVPQQQVQWIYYPVVVYR